MWEGGSNLMHADYHFSHIIWTPSASAWSMAHMFEVTSVFNQALDHFDTSNVKYFEKMFSGNKSTFDSFSCLRTSSSHFWTPNPGSAFNQDINGWDISSATSMRLMFYRYVMYRVNFPGAKKRCLKHRYFFAPFSNVAFNQELCAWGVHYDSSKDYTNMFYNSQSCTISGGTPQSSLGPWCSCMNTESPTSSPTGAPSGVRNTLDHLIVLPDLILP